MSKGISRFAGNLLLATLVGSALLVIAGMLAALGGGMSGSAGVTVFGKWLAFLGAGLLLLLIVTPIGRFLGLLANASRPAGKGENRSQGMEVGEDRRNNETLNA